MKLTDLFIRRPVLALVVSLGDPDRRTAVDQSLSVRQFRAVTSP
jgi:hypothetical protein